ncbi:MAG: peroxiredoxin family protein [Bacteroidota bacterium]
MKKRVQRLLVLAFFIVGGFLVFQVIRGFNEKKEAEERIQSIPQAAFVSLTGEKVSLRDFDPAKPLVIIYFHPECDYCQYEAQEIAQNSIAFNNCQLVMITADDSLQRIEQFCNEYNFWEIDNLEVLQDEENRFKKIFGKAVIPSIYIYDENQKLTKCFLGETKPEAIIAAIR